MLRSENESRLGAGAIQKIIVTVLAAVAVLLTAPILATAQEESPIEEAETGGAQASPSDAVSIELNKLEAKGSNCRAFFLINNKTDRAFDKLQMEFYVFRPDGVIDQSFAADLAPLKAKKLTVKRFDISNTSCDKVSSILINDVAKCQAGTEELSNCLEMVTVSSKADTELSK
ncbi:MAG: Tat pathway signal sequence domain protein [Pseudomonadota bacterium]